MWLEFNKHKQKILIYKTLTTLTPHRPEIDLLIKLNYVFPYSNKFAANNNINIYKIFSLEND